jgi:dTDP-glucose pyrophosphorylase
MNWKEIVLASHRTIKTAIKMINSSEFKIILVISKNKKLIGTVTDGDIRRYFLYDSGNLGNPISKIMSKNPFFSNESSSDSNILKKMVELKLNYIPIVNKNKNIIGLKTKDILTNKVVYKNPVLLMAGGFGKRMMPLTKTTPKPLLKINGTPMLEIIIRKFIKYGFKNFYISTFYKSDLIKKYFGNGKKWNVNIKYLEENKPLGTAGALQLLPIKDIKLPVFVINGDVLTNVNFRDLLDSHSKKNIDATVCVREQSVKSEFGIVKINKGLLKKIDEKPINKFLINAGIYVINHDKIPKLKKNTYVDMPSLLNEMVCKKKKINTYFLYEDWLDIGHISEYNKAINSKISK